jgi:hypothetical protein
VSAAALHNAHIDVLAAQKAALERRIASATLTAPADGIIVQSHFDKQLGQVFTQGQAVLEFAPEGGWEIEVHVPENIATLVVPNQSGLFASVGSSGEGVPCKIRQVEGAARVIEGKNVFVARAELASDSKWIRSGMRGVARIRTSRKAVCWVVFHKFVDWTRLHFWI